MDIRIMDFTARFNRLMPDYMSKDYNDWNYLPLPPSQKHHQPPKKNLSDESIKELTNWAIVYP